MDGIFQKRFFGFSRSCKKNLGYALGAVQNGKNPGDIRGLKVKAIKGYTGASVMEIIENYDTNTYRAVYTAQIGQRIYILHCFQKKSKSGIATPQPDLKVIEARLKEAREMVKNEE